MNLTGFFAIEINIKALVPISKSLLSKPNKFIN